MTVFRGALVFKQLEIPGLYQELPPNAWAKVTFAVTDYDTDSLWSATGNQFVIPADVNLVRLSGQIVWAHTLETFDRQTLITKNNALFNGYAAQNSQPVTATTHDQNVTSPVLRVQPGDTFQLQAWHARPAGNMSINNNGGSTWFQIEVLG